VVSYIQQTEVGARLDHLDTLVLQFALVQGHDDPVVVVVSQIGSAHDTVRHAGVLGAVGREISFTVDIADGNC